METKSVFQFKIIVFVSSFRFIWIPILRVYGHYKYFIIDVKFWPLKSISALQGFINMLWLKISISWHRNIYISVSYIYDTEIYIICPLILFAFFLANNMYINVSSTKSIMHVKYIRNVEFVNSWKKGCVDEDKEHDERRMPIRKNLLSVCMSKVCVLMIVIQQALFPWFFFVFLCGHLVLLSIYRSFKTRIANRAGSEITPFAHNGWSRGKRSPIYQFTKYAIFSNHIRNNSLNLNSLAEI